MQDSFDPRKNYRETRDAIGYVPRKDATQKDYDRIGFMSGLEVHQQLNTKQKLFCRCPAGIFQKPDEYDAELVRHMRPTLSELGEYDGTALMEFRTKKEIIYRISNETACTYDVDDTPPFPLNREALEQALEISLLSKLKIVGEVHITRKQYLDGSIPTGFQRTAIIGVEGEIQLKNKKIRLIQLSLEEDACREVSDIGHVRIYRTDRLGMPLIETVTYPDFVNPDEVLEGADYIRFLNRSTGKVRTGIGSTRADVNVSCKGGTRVEIKGVAHTRWMPELTHNEAFRQWALLHIRELLLKRTTASGEKITPEVMKKAAEAWTMTSGKITDNKILNSVPYLKEATEKGYPVLAINLPKFKGILSHFLQPDHDFADELKHRLKVIACIEYPNMLHSEMFEDQVGEENWQKIREQLGATHEDAQVLVFGPDADIPTALETVEERCKMAFEGVPNETRKSFEDGTTIFERVLPGADRMYPDTDTAPIPLSEEVIEEMTKKMPLDISVRIAQLMEWGVGEDMHTYLLKNNLVPLIEQIRDELDIAPKYTATLLAQRLNHIQRVIGPVEGFDFGHVYQLLAFLKLKKLSLELAEKLLWEVYQYPDKSLEEILKESGKEGDGSIDVEQEIDKLSKEFRKLSKNPDPGKAKNWIMGELRKKVLGHVPMEEIAEKLKTIN